MENYTPYSIAVGLVVLGILTWVFIDKPEKPKKEDKN